MAETKFKETKIGLIPEGWEVKPLGEVAHIHKGIQFNKADMNTAGSYPVINGGIDASGYIELYNCDKDTITVSQGGASAGYVNWLSQKFWAGAHCYVVKTNKGVSNKYLYNVLKFNEGTFMNSKYGGNIPALAINTLLNFFVPIPPQEEQERIAVALSSVDELIASLDKQIAKTRDIRQGAMQRLLSVLPRTTYRPLVECLGYEQPAKYIVRSSDYFDAGTPVLTAGQTFILGYTNETDGVFQASKENPVIIFDDFTTSFHWVDFNFKVKSSAMKMLRPINKNVLFKYVYYAMSCINYVPEEHSRQWISFYSNFTIPLPSLEEQKHIADVLTSFDNTIEGLEAKRQKYESIKAGMMQQLLTGTIRLS